MNCSMHKYQFSLLWWPLLPSHWAASYRMDRPKSCGREH